ncbi:hypothetical protein BS47DRAFT_1266809, partial [Hydnum rufescens UP504]
LITLPNLCIINYVVGHTGSAHDSTCFLDSRVVREHAQLFDPGEWIWANSTYAIEPWCIVPYKKPHRLLPINWRFNTCLAHISTDCLIIIRIKSEHAISFLKSRFSSLCGLWQQIDNPQDHELAVMWVCTCVVLH